MDNQIRLALNEIRNAVAHLSEIPVNAEVPNNICLNGDASPVNNSENVHGDFLLSQEQAVEDLNRAPSPPGIHQNESDNLQIPSTSHAADHSGHHGGNFNPEFAVNPDQIQRERFNNIEIRRPFAMPPPCPGNVPDLAAIYINIMCILTELADTARSLTRRNDVVQLELVGENLNRNVKFTVTDDGNMILPAFEDFLDELVQSSAEMPADNNLEFVLQVVNDPAGGSKCKVKGTLD
ncbi:hypothetical protein GOODEAATRI_032788 [Goodea atripinnis]|uniref:Uncharacterized protein n=1 Tax=Goodea atripinnis TaxID=208336 RepID=A0ABV0Q334_9TELE